MLFRSDNAAVVHILDSRTSRTPLHNAALAPFDASCSQPNTFPVSIIKLLTLFPVSVGRNFANWL